jgi:acetyl-CoA carboxylase carboxyl transferase subunit alpha
MRFGVIDQIVNEPVGGAHRDPDVAIARVGDALEDALRGFAGLTPEEIRRLRREKFLAVGRSL